MLRVQPGNLDEPVVFRVDRPWEPPIVVGDTRERHDLELRSVSCTVVSYVVFTLMVLAWAAVAWLAQRDAVLGVFIAHQASMLLLSLARLGMSRLWALDWIPASAIDLLTSVMIPITVAARRWRH